VDRQIVYPGSIPLDTDILSLQRNTMVALGYLVQATLGAAPAVDGLACTATSPASLTVQVGPGSIITMGPVEASPFGSLPSDTADPLMKMGVNTQPVPFTLTAPATSGQSIAYLIQASILEADALPIVLPYYNAANPLQPFSGQDNSGAAQNTRRVQKVQLQVKPGAPANAGAQAAPSVDAGWVGLYVVTVSYGQTQLTAASIAQTPNAPFVQFKLPALSPGFSRQTVLTASGTWTTPNNVALVRVSVCGGGGGGGSGSGSFGGAGGGAGGYAQIISGVTPGQQTSVLVGAGGAGGTASGALPGTGGPSNFGGLISASGGTGGANNASFSSGGAPGLGAGGSLNLPGGYGSDGNAGSYVFAGNGGASFFGGGGRAATGGNSPEQQGQAYGSGAGGAYGGAGNGGAVASGVVIIEF
jgi:hypothetical protein